MATNYQGGGDTNLSSFFTGIGNAYRLNQNNIAKQRLAQDKIDADYQKELSTVVKKINPNGVQQFDIPEMSQKLSNLYDTYYKANKAKTTEEKLTLKMDLEKQLTDFSQFAANSKDSGLKRAKIAGMVVDPKYAGLFSEEAKNKFKDIATKPTSQLGLEDLSPEKYITPDTSYLDKTEDALVKSLWSAASSSIKYGERMKIGNQMGTKQDRVTAIKEDLFGTGLIELYRQDVKYRNLINYEAGKYGITPEALIVEKARGLKYLNEPKVQALEAKMDARPRSSKSGSGSASAKADTYRQQNIEGILKGDTEAIGRTKASLLPTAEMSVHKTKDGRKFVRFKTPEKDFEGGDYVEVFYDEPHAFTKLNNYLNIVTGEKITSSKTGIQGAKPTGALKEPIVKAKINKPAKIKTEGLSGIALINARKKNKENGY